MTLPESYWPKKIRLAVSDQHGHCMSGITSRSRAAFDVALPVGMEEFTPKEIQRVFAPAAEYARTLAKYDVDLIVQSGVPLPCVMGPDFLDELLGRMQEASGIPTIANVLSMVAGAKRLGLKNIALANKWTDPMNQNLAKFFAREGIKVAGWSTHVMTPKEFEGMGLQQGLDLSYQLGAAAFTKFPEPTAYTSAAAHGLACPARFAWKKNLANRFSATRPLTFDTASSCWVCGNPSPATCGCWPWNRPKIQVAQIFFFPAATRYLTKCAA